MIQPHKFSEKPHNVNKDPAIMPRTGQVLACTGFCVNSTHSMLFLTMVPDLLNDRKDHLQRATEQRNNIASITDCLHHKCSRQQNMNYSFTLQTSRQYVNTHLSQNPIETAISLLSSHMPTNNFIYMLICCGFQSLLKTALVYWKAANDFIQKGKKFLLLWPFNRQCTNFAVTT